MVQLGAVCMIILGLVGKFGGLFASLPGPLISGLFCIVLGLISAGGSLVWIQISERMRWLWSQALSPLCPLRPLPPPLPVGLSMMVHADQQSERNILIGGWN